MLSVSTRKLSCSGALAASHAIIVVCLLLLHSHCFYFRHLSLQFPGQECQRKDWATHKNECRKGKKWYDRYRLCRDGSKHHGKLELMTWGESAEDAEFGDATGWGCCLIDECEGLKKLYETKYGSDDAKFYKYWPQGFRWTCCGTDGSMSYGCDHHGTGPKPCTCDFCR